MGIKSKRRKQEHGDMKCTCGHILVHKEHLIDLDNRVKSGKMAFKDATADHSLGKSVAQVRFLLGALDGPQRRSTHIEYAV